jgi:SRSO17 transposase
MIEPALSADVPFSRVAADSVHGVGDIEMALRRAGKGHVPGVSARHAFNSRGKAHAISGTAGSIEPPK